MSFVSSGKACRLHPQNQLRWDGLGCGWFSFG